MKLETEARAIEAFRRKPRVLGLACGVQHYDWGDPDAIPTILRDPNTQRRPFAELWAGAHPDLPSQALVDSVRVPLDLLVRDAAKEILGRDVASRFHGDLPFLLKILAAAKPLSIQAHPNRAQALLGFERENLEGLPLDAAARNYRDPRHKPELLVALTDFYVLRGFRSPAEIEQTLSRVPELAPLARHSVRDTDTLAALYGHIMQLHQAGLRTLLEPLIGRLENEENQRPLTPEEPEFWVLRAHRELSTPGRMDPGLLSILLLNLVRLRPGQAIFLPAGELHAYLKGVGIELMANSNNVLRGGLTPKHVDTDELLRILSFEGGTRELLEPATSAHEPRLSTYRAPATEFELSRLALDPGGEFAFEPGEMRLALLTGGTVDIAEVERPRFQAHPGEALLVPAGLGCLIQAADAAELWLANVPQNRSRRR
jgi:mannose-6-phosphate isomerase class I